MNKKNLLALFGGQSSEHVVSCMSAQNVIADIDTEKYDVTIVGITEEGHWLLVDSLDQIRDGSWRMGRTEAVLSPDACDKSLLILKDGSFEKRPVDVVFPILHGLYGEDGTVQGMLELARIPYVGCGVLASAVSMDKLSTKIVVDDLGIRQAKYVKILKEEYPSAEEAAAKVEETMEFPVFIKPSNAGSSRGVSRATDHEELVAGLEEASNHDRRILVEEEIRGREVECAVYGGGSEEIVASGVGEILAAAEFYDFDAKYYNSDSRTLVDPVFPGNAREEIRKAAVEIFRAVDGYGLSRVDFFLKEDGTVVFNEINTMPGFTAISMYPMLFEAAGTDKKKMVDQLISHALKRFER